VHLVRVSGQPRPNPWRELVLGARAELARQDALGDVKVELGPAAEPLSFCRICDSRGVALHPVNADHEYEAELIEGRSFTMTEREARELSADVLRRACGLPKHRIK
jgi:hypothetical protein